MSERYPGELVWLPDAEVVWRAGEIVKVEGSTIWVSKDSSAEPSIVDGQKLLARGKDEYTGGGLEVLEDLTQLPHLHEASVLNSLQHAFELDQIYTFTGPILIAINPFRSISGLYGPEVMQDFLVKSGGSSGSSGKPKPHVFAVANAACQGMRTKRTSQTVLISGESGAGKTESTKYVMRLVTASGGAPRQESDDDKGSVEGRILASNPILEAFGNAKTLRNDNSSRFGKFIALQFEDKDAGELVSSKVETYLLEKVRVVDQQEGERNYHIFYQACAASASDRRTGDVLKSLSLKGLQSHSAFRYLTKSSCSVLKAGIDDAVEFEHTATALRSIGLDDTTLDVFVGVIAAILNAGNLDFEDAGAGSDGSKVPDRCKDTLTLVGELLGVEATTLESAMCNRTIRDPRGETMTSPVKPAQAFDARDALARQLYGSLFDYIVKQINKSIGLGDSNGKEVAMLFVGVLDIFGFECFKLNSFEQLCINFTNELLQQYFNAFIFAHEAELYKREGISWDPADFPDNKEILALLNASPGGIFAMLDEECITVGGTAKSWERKLQQKHGGHPHFATKPQCHNVFDIKHFAGPVAYTADAFLEKNKDLLSSDVMQLLKDPQACKNAFVTRQFSGELERIFGAGAAGGSEQRRVTKAKSYSVSSDFREQMESLMSTIKATEPHFVRCLKPNPRNAPHDFVRPAIVEQLRYQGVLQAVEVSRAGYPVRMSLQECWEEYRVLMPLQRQRNLEPRAALDRARGLLQYLDQHLSLPKHPSNGLCWAVGKTKVFLKQEPANVIQGALLERRRTAATKLASHYKMVSCRRRFQRIRQACVRFQARVRGAAARGELWRRRRQRASLRIQRRWRGRVGRQRAAKGRGLVLRLQGHARMLPTRRHFRSQRGEAIRLQRWWRWLIRRRRLKNLRRSVHRIQVAWRGYAGRKEAVEQMVRVLRRKRAVRVLLRFWRRKVAQRVRRAQLVEFYNSGKAGVAESLPRGQLCAALKAEREASCELSLAKESMGQRLAESDAQVRELRREVAKVSAALSLTEEELSAQVQSREQLEGELKTCQTSVIPSLESKNSALEEERKALKASVETLEAELGRRTGMSGCFAILQDLFGGKKPTK
eukprot:TRINITY_DN7068_c0_g2_i2.p1 TRINITY_DN7068_c0_g2~~TRINITY_DN7068_c0_g2_i2.p1  ORF type:complete len:1114 (+),score=269.70 TRINITY_DN7068_c0_g2_i2:89-3430(+)